MSCKHWISVAGAVLLTAVLGLGGAPEVRAATIRIALPASQGEADHEGALVFQHFVERRTSGALKVEIFPNGALCADRATCMEQVRAGEIEATVSTTAELAGLFPEGAVLELPYLFRDDRVAACVLDGPFRADLRAAVLAEAPAMRLVTIANTGGWRNFATAGRPVRRPEDLRGLTIRTVPAEIQVELVRLLGGSPVPVLWPEVGASLAAGAIDGAKSDIGAITAMKLEEHLDHITLDGHTYGAGFWWINDAFFMALPPEHRKIVHDGFQHLATVTRASLMRQAIAAYEAFEAAGGEVHVPSPDERQAFVEATAAMKDWFKSRHGDAWLIKLEKAIADCEQQIAAEYAPFVDD